MSPITNHHQSADAYDQPQLRRRRLLLGSLLLVLGLLGLLWLAGQWAKVRLAHQYPPPGQLIDVGGYKLHLDCRGQGSPTVLLEAGLNDFSVHWALVQPAVAQFTRVCTYDRAGLGWSEPSPRPRTSQTIAEELHTLAHKADESGAYILVGHSFGGIVMREFTRRFPEQVAGLVLVDSAHEAQGERIPTLRTAVAQMRQQFRVLAWLNAFGLLALAPTQIPDRGLPTEALAQYRARLAAAPYFETALAESAAFYTQVAPELTIERMSLGALPLIVLSRGQAAPLPGSSDAENAALEQSWRMLQAELVTLSTNSQQQIAKASGHEIHLQQPDLVVAAIRRLVQGK